MNLDKMNQWMELARKCTQEDFWDGFMEAETEGKTVTKPSWTPPVDIFRSELQAWVWVELPGVRREEVDIVYTGDTIVVKGTKSNRMMIRDIPLSECYTGSFERSIRLPFPVDWNQASAKLSEGILLIRLSLLPVMESKIHIE